jgi:hypothetical protein
MYIHLVRYCCDKDRMVDSHRSVSFYGGLKFNVVSMNRPTSADRSEGVSHGKQLCRWTAGSKPLGVMEKQVCTRSGI